MENGRVIKSVYLVNEISIAPITCKKRFILGHILCIEYVVALQI